MSRDVSKSGALRLTPNKFALREQGCFWVVDTHYKAEVVRSA